MKMDLENSSVRGVETAKVRIWRCFLLSVVLNFWFLTRFPGNFLTS